MMDYFKFGGLYLLIIIVCIIAAYVATTLKKSKYDILFPSQKDKYIYLMKRLGYDHFDIK